MKETRAHNKLLMVTFLALIGTSMKCTLTKTQDQVALCCHGNDFRPQEIVKQHLQAQQLDGGEGGGELDAGVEAHPRRIGCAVETWRSCNDRKHTNELFAKITAQDLFRSPNPKCQTVLI